MIDPQKLQVLLEVAQRAPASLAEQIVCREVAAALAQLIAEQQRRAEPTNDERRTTNDE